ncbi:MAG: DMT family transporter [Candidatus Krumholzibacteriota bacterium]|nr:DMT family transporter [Candidatus Krumholzibacteriota bacterium]
MKSKIIRYDCLLFFTAAIWGFAFVAQRVGMKYVGPFIFNGVRFALAALVLFPFVLVRRYKFGYGWTGKRRHVLVSGFLAGLFLFIASSLQQVGVVYTTAGKAGFFWKRQVGGRTWLGAVLAVIGLYLLSIAGGLRLVKGDILVFAGAFFWAGHVLLIGSFSKSIDPLVLAFIQCAVCSLLSLAVSIFTEVISLTALYSAAVPIIYGGVFSVGVAYTFQILAQRYTPAAHASVIMSFEAVFAVLGGWLILGEVLSLRGIAGCTLMFAGMIISQLGVIADRRRGKAGDI